MAVLKDAKSAKPKKVALKKVKANKLKSDSIKTNVVKSQKNDSKSNKNKFLGHSHLKKINLSQVGYWLKFSLKWLMITATIFFFVGGPIIAAWVSDRDSKQQKKEQEEYQKQYEEVVKKAQEEAASKPKSYDESLKYSDDVTSLQIIDERTGDGTEAKGDDTIKVKYKGVLASTGEVFDQNDEGIDLSLSSVISGWQEGIPGMKVGGVRLLRIPSEKAYGDQANSSIPANSDLIFRVELLEINPPTDQAQ